MKQELEWAIMRMSNVGWRAHAPGRATRTSGEGACRITTYPGRGSGGSSPPAQARQNTISTEPNAYSSGWITPDILGSVCALLISLEGLEKRIDALAADRPGRLREVMEIVVLSGVW